MYYILIYYIWYILYYVFHTLIFVSDIYILRMLKLLWRCFSDCGPLRKYHLAAAVQQQTSAGFFLRIPIHKNITHTQIGISVATLTWKWLWREQRYHEKVTNWYNTLFYNNARMCQPWLKVIFHHSWRPACSVLLRDELWDTFERSGVITCHYGSVQHQKTDTWQKTTLESDGYPLQKLTWQRKITIFCLKMRYIFQRLTCPLSCWFSEGTFHWWMKSPWWNPSDEVCQVGWRKWSYVRQLLSARAYPDWGGCGWMFWWKKWFWDMISVKMFFWICESLTRLYVLDFVLCNTW